MTDISYIRGLLNSVEELGSLTHGEELDLANVASTLEQLLSEREEHEELQHAAGPCPDCGHDWGDHGENGCCLITGTDHEFSGHICPCLTRPPLVTP